MEISQDDGRNALVNVQGHSPDAGHKLDHWKQGSVVQRSTALIMCICTTSSLQENGLKLAAPLPPSPRLHKSLMSFQSG